MIRQKATCVDLPYLIITSIVFLTIIGWSIAKFDIQNINNLSMPRDGNGNACWNDKIHGYTYIRIYGPSIINRQCVSTCTQQQLNRQLGGICIQPRVQHILKQSGQYQQYIQTKLNSLNRIKIVGITIAFTLSIALLIMFMYQLMSFCCGLRIIGNFIVLLSIKCCGTVLYFLYGIVRGYVWAIVCAVVVVYVVYVIVWKICRRYYSLQQSNKTQQNNQQIRHTFVQRSVLTIITALITLLLIITILFEYVSLTSSSPHNKWISPNLYAQVNGITYNEIILFVWLLYIVSFTLTLRICGIILDQYLIASMQVTSLGIVNAMYSGIRCHMGSVCKLAIIRLVFGIPIFILTLIKPIQTQSCANCCHCMCGWMLNLGRKYTLPMHAYQSIMKQPLNIDQAGHRLHYQSHINGYQYSQGYIEKISALLLIGCAAFGSVYLLEKYWVKLPISLFTLCVAVFVSMWVSSFFISSWVHAKQAHQVKQICQANRAQLTL